jgi:hypothetical protein
MPTPLAPKKAALKIHRYGFERCIACGKNSKKDLFQQPARINQRFQ